MKKTLIAFTMLCIGTLAFSAEISQQRKSIRTYPFGGEDPVPIFVRGDGNGRYLKLYPYTFFDEFTAKPEQKDWTIVTLENPYIEVNVMPEIGGKVWGAKEKSTSRNFIYANDVVKFREIALRGPWTSGGIEFNFGLVGHAPSTSTPVDYLTRENADGSVSCIVGAMDLPSRARWSVEIRLPQDKSQFETRAFYYNPSAIDQSYYCWMNSAAKVSDDMQVIFPGTKHIAHDFKVPLKPWPISREGRDLSWYKNNTFGSHKSYFTVGEYEDFFGCYWHDDAFGAGHYARYSDMPGHKVWLWALSRQGGIWEDLLTDQAGQYAELQSGRFFNQNDHGFLTAAAGDAWREVWFPYKDTGPMVKASESAVLSLTENGEGYKLALCAIAEIDEDLAATSDGEEILRRHISLQPMQTYETMIDRPANGNIDISLGGLLSYTTDKSANDIDKPINFHEIDESTSEGLYLAGVRAEKSRAYRQAREKYNACVRQQPKHVRAMGRIAGIYLRSGQLQDALATSADAIKIEMYDPYANYIYGLASRRLGNLTDAKEALGWAARSMKYRSAANTQLAEIAIFEDDCETAAKLARTAINCDARNVDALQAQAIAFRRLNRPADAQDALDRISEIEPLNHYARFEKYRLGKSDKKSFTSLVRSEYADETFVEMGVYYASLGLDDEANRLFEFAGEYPTAVYWQAYLQKSPELLARADSLDPAYAFPFREESIPVFEWAAGKSRSWKPNYYLGLICWSKARFAEASKLLNKVESDSFAPFYITRAYMNESTDKSSALADYKKAVEMAPKNRRTWHHLVSFYIEQKNYDQAITAAREGINALPEEQQLEIDLLRALVPAGRYAQALDILEKTSVLPFEGASEVHQLYVKTHMGLGRAAMEAGNYEKAIEHFQAAKEYPERLGTGKPYDPDYSEQNKLIEKCRQAMEK